MNVMQELCALRRADAEKRARTCPLADLERQIASLPPAKDFAAAFEAGRGPRVIAELKKASPSKGLIRADFRPADLAAELVAAGAAALSILCEPHKFLGNEDYIRIVRGETPVPVLYKDFVTTPYQVAAARAAGADAVLLIVAALSQESLASLLACARGYGLQALVETHTAEEMSVAVSAGARIIGVNCRDLKTFHTDPAITAGLIRQLPQETVKIAESGIRTREDIDSLAAAGANGFLIGETIMRAEHPGGALCALVAGGHASGFSEAPVEALPTNLA